MALIRRLGGAGLAIVLVLGGVAMTGGAAGADATHTVAVTPNTGLADAQTVTVDGTGFTEFGTAGEWTVAECDGAQVDLPLFISNALHNCDVHPESTVTLVAADASGHLTTPFTVHTTIAIESGTLDCRTAPNGCAILVGQLLPGGSTVAGAVVPISFAPPPPPPPTTIRDCVIALWHGAVAHQPRVLHDFLRCVIGVLREQHHR
jgi:hypothetical protein